MAQVLFLKRFPEYMVLVDNLHVQAEVPSVHGATRNTTAFEKPQESHTTHDSALAGSRPKGNRLSAQQRCSRKCIKDKAIRQRKNLSERILSSFVTRRKT